MEKITKIALTLLFGTCSTAIQADDITLKITQRYLNLPVSHQTDKKKMSFTIDGKEERSFVIRLAPGKPDYWAFCDMDAYKGKKLTISYDGEG